MNTQAILKSIRLVRVLCTGDLWLDRWSRHDPFLSTPAPETGLESTVLVATEDSAGGCGLSAAAAAALGAEVTVLGVVGDDGSGIDLRRSLERAGVQQVCLLTGSSPTPVTTRLINTRTGAEDAGRIEVVQFLQPEAIAVEFQAELRRLAPLAQCVIAVDAKPPALGGLIGTAGRAGLAEIAGLAPFLWLDSAEGFQQVRGGGQPSLIIQPDGQGGIGIEEGPARQVVPETSPAHPLDPHGARETFSTAAALALAAGTDAAQAVRFALMAAAVCMMKPGARCASPEEILRAERELSE